MIIPPDYELCERTDLSMEEVVSERSELLNLNRKLLQLWHLEAIDHRLDYLNNRIIEEYLNRRDSLGQ
jgi:hypothetical protein